MAKKTVQLQGEYTKRQTQADIALARDDVRRLLYGGAKGGGKSFFLCVWMFCYAWEIAARFGLKTTKNPLHIGWMGRKQATDFTATTLQTWRKTIPEEYYELKGGTEKDPKHILIMNRVAIDYGGLDRQESINKFNSAEYAVIALDQAEETTKDDVSVLQGSLRLTIQGQALPYKELYTANPAACWLKDEFVTNCPVGNVFVPALPADNPYLPDDYEKTLTDAFGYRKELLEAYLHGNWASIEGARQVILDSLIERAMKMPTLLGGKVIACDPARFGDDKTTIKVLEGSEIIEQSEMGYSRTTDISDALTELSRRHNNCQLVVDEIGVGGGVIDELHKNGRRVIAFNSSEKADNPEKFVNKRAEAWWELAEHFAKGEIGCRNMTKELRSQLTTPCYDFRNGKIIIEPKETIKERIGRSPDDADCYVMGIWAVKRARPEMQYANAGQPSKTYSNNILTRGLQRRTA
ncbi:MAG: hypothetical protein PHP01_06540 [Phycisphaerae bacterium]|nr:hypothetical protein [Phycisphaerae bacterium]